MISVMTHITVETHQTFSFVDVLGKLGFSVSIFILAFGGVPGKTMSEKK